MRALVYPKPFKVELSSLQSSDGDVDGSVVAEGQDDFSGLRAYNNSDSLRTVDWKSYARRNQLFTKEFHGYQSRSIWLRWSDFPVNDLELKLSGLCYWVLVFANKNDPFGLEIPGRVIKPGQGKLHELACLRALAEFEYGR
jgi:uncharacterized protein (DUF58 family)